MIGENSKNKENEKKIQRWICEYSVYICSLGDLNCYICWQPKGRNYLCVLWVCWAVLCICCQRLNSLCLRVCRDVSCSHFLIAPIEFLHRLDCLLQSMVLSVGRSELNQWWKCKEQAVNIFSRFWGRLIFLSSLKMYTLCCVVIRLCLRGRTASGPQRWWNLETWMSLYMIDTLLLRLERRWSF